MKIELAISEDSQIRRL